MFVKTEEGIKTTTLERRRRLTIASRSSVEGSFETENLICIWPITEIWVTIDNWHWWRISMNSPAAPSHPRKASTKRAVYETCPRLEWASKHAGFTTIWQKSMLRFFLDFATLPICFWIIWHIYFEVLENLPTLRPRTFHTKALCKGAIVGAEYWTVFQIGNYFPPLYLLENIIHTFSYIYFLNIIHVFLCGPI